MATKRYLSRVPFQPVKQHQEMALSVIAGMFLQDALAQLRPGSKIVAVMVEAEGPDDPGPGTKPEAKPKPSPKDKQP